MQNNVIEENPTRQRILLLLKKRGWMTTDDLSKELKITPMGIRQHLLALEKKGIVTYKAKRHGIGRPGFLYMLTDEADDLFPKRYHIFLIDILKEIERREGRGKVDDLFRFRMESLLERIKNGINGGRGLSERIERISEMLQREGYLAEVEEDGESYYLKQYNCPISVVSRIYKEACRYELEMYRELLGDGVSRTACLSDGASACIYRIPKTCEEE